MQAKKKKTTNKTVSARRWKRRGEVSQKKEKGRSGLKSASGGLLLMGKEITYIRRPKGKEIYVGRRGIGHL